MLYEQLFLLSLLLALIIEVPVAILLIRCLYKHKEIKISKIIFTGVIASALTLPYLWFILPSYISARNLYILVGEFLVILIEAVIYNQFLGLKLLEASTVSIIANIISAFLGIIIF